MSLTDNMKGDAEKYVQLKKTLTKLERLLPSKEAEYRASFSKAYAKLLEDMKNDFKDFSSRKKLNVDTPKARAWFNGFEITYSLPANKTEGLSMFTINFNGPASKNHFNVNLVPNNNVTLGNVKGGINTKQLPRRTLVLKKKEPSAYDIQEDIELKQSALNAIEDALQKGIEFSFVWNQFEARTFKEILEKIDESDAVK